MIRRNVLMLTAMFGIVAAVLTGCGNEKKLLNDGNMYFENKKYKEAVDCYEKVLEHGLKSGEDRASVCNKLTYCYLRGLGTAKNVEKAIATYAQMEAEKHYNANLEFEIAECVTELDRKKVEKEAKLASSPEEAMEAMSKFTDIAFKEVSESGCLWLGKAAKHGNAKAMGKLAKVLLLSNEPEKNPEEIIRADALLQEAKRKAKIDSDVEAMETANALCYMFDEKIAEAKEVLKARKAGK